MRTGSEKKEAARKESVIEVRKASSQLKWIKKKGEKAKRVGKKSQKRRRQEKKERRK